MVPGGQGTRTKVAQMFLAPKWLWAAPLLAAPPLALASHVMRAIIESGCTWWCKGRWWADRIELHPSLGMAIRTCVKAESLDTKCSTMGMGTVQAHAKNLDLEVVRWTRDQGGWSADVSCEGGSEG